jgi:hypothetical protein
MDLDLNLYSDVDPGLKTQNIAESIGFGTEPVP